MHYIGEMNCYFYYCYDLTKYKDKLSKKLLENLEIYGKDCYQDVGGFGYLKFKNKLFVGYIAACLECTDGSEIISLDKKDFEINFEEFEKTIKKLEQLVQITIDVEPKIICYTEKSNHNGYENYSKYYSYLSYYLIYGYELNELEIELDDVKLKKLGYAHKKLISNKTDFLMFEDYGCSLAAGYIVEKLSTRIKYHSFENFYENINKINTNKELLKITQIISELYKDEKKKMPELKLLAIKIDNPE